MTSKTLGPAGSRTSRAAHLEFLRDAAPYREDLFRFCRYLTRSPWDAEDLAQETLLKIYGRLGDKHAGVASPKSYLFKTAAHLWIDWCRRARQPLEDQNLTAEESEAYCYLDVRPALIAVLQFLPPRERLAFVLKDVFEMTLEEVANVSQTSVNAVKAALHRARTKLPTAAEQAFEVPQRSCAESKDMIEKAVLAFNRRDIEAMSALLLTTATANGPGCFLEDGIEEIKRGSLFYTFKAHDGAPLPESMQAQSISFLGETLFSIWNGDALDDVWRFQVSDGKIARFDCYYCSPGVLGEIAESLGVAFKYHGYFFEDHP